MANPFATLTEEPESKPGGNPFATLVEKNTYDLADVPAAALKSATKTLTEDVPAAASAAVEHPGEAAKKVGEVALDSTRTVAGLVNPMSVAYPILKSIGLAKSAEKFRELSRDYMMSDPGAAGDIASGLIEKYGGWENVKRAAAEQPLSTTFDIVSLAVPAAKGASAAIKSGTGAVRSMLAAGVPAETRLARAGLKAEEIAHLEPAQADILADIATRSGNRKTLRQEYNRLLHDESEIAPTKSMVTNERIDQSFEDKMRNGSRGPFAVDTMKVADEARAESLAEANAKLRASLTGSNTPMEPVKVGEVIGERFNTAHGSAKKVVSGLYEKAFDPTELAAAGVTANVPKLALQQLPSAIYDSFVNHPRGPFVASKTLAPNTFEAMQALGDFSKSGKLPDMFPPKPAVGGGVSWETTDLMRRYLNGLRESAKMNPTDLTGMRRVLDAFDYQMGKTNPLLNQARKAHSERVDLFDPSRNKSAAGVRGMTQAATNTENTGYTLYNKLFGGTALKKGEALALVNKLKTVFANDPGGMQAVREGAVHRLFNDAKLDKPLSPQRLSTALSEALSGPQAETYRALFTPEQLRALSRRQALASNISKNSQRLNNSGTSYGTESESRRRWAMGVGAVAGSGLATAGRAAGLPIPHVVGEGLGAIIGGAALPLAADPYYASRARSLSSYGRPRAGTLARSLPLPGVATISNAEPVEEARGFFGGGR